MVVEGKQSDINFTIMITTLVILTEDLNFQRGVVHIHKCQISGISVIVGNILGGKQEIQLILHSSLLSSN